MYVQRYPGIAMFFTSGYSYPRHPHYFFFSQRDQRLVICSIQGRPVAHVIQLRIDIHLLECELLVHGQIQMFVSFIKSS